MAVLRGRKAGLTWIAKLQSASGIGNPLNLEVKMKKQERSIVPLWKRSRLARKYDLEERRLEAKRDRLCQV